MSTTLTKLRTAVSIKFAQLDNSQGLNGTVGGDMGVNSPVTWSVGTNTAYAANQTFFPTSYLLNGGNTTTIDLTNSTANKNPNNIGLTLARAKGMYLEINSTTGTVNGTLVNMGVLINGLVTNSALDLKGTIPFGGRLYWENGTANGNTIDSTHKLITLTNLDATNSVTVQLGVWGGQT